ncbi:hypothetical protein QZH41_017850, partial [Actinostola sp. cb2023]
MSDRSRRRVEFELLLITFIDFQALKSIIRESNTVDDPSTSCDAMPIGEVEIGASNVDILESDAPEGSFVNNIPDDATHIASKEMDSELDVETELKSSPNCTTCRGLKNHNRQLENKLISLRIRLKNRRAEVKLLNKTSKGKHSRHNKATQTRNENLAHVQGNLTEHEQELDYDMVEDDQDYFSEPEFSNYQMETETETETETDDPDPTITSEKLSMEDTNLRTEPKHIVFLSKLLLLFHFCHVCKDDNPLVEISQVGTGVVVTTTCNNEKCPKKKNVWHSQPTIPGWDVPAGNFILCMAVLLVGGSATKVFQMFSHMGLGCFLKTHSSNIKGGKYCKCIHSKLFPTIYIYWQRCQAKMLEKVKSLRDGVSVAGDGRHDSMGHCAKYGAYSVFCCTLPMIIHFSLIQRNQAGNSPAMELMGLRQSMDYLIGYGIPITTFISDRHIGIACHMKNMLSHITHYFDIWHLKK